MGLSLNVWNAIFYIPIELKEFTSFEQGLNTIRTNLNKKLGKTVKVYELVRKDKSVAVLELLY